MDVPLTEEGLSLFLRYCGIDRKTIEKRAIAIREKALKIHHYRFIEAFRFLHPRIASNPFISDLPLHDGKILDIGCGFGTDLRYLALRGVHPSNLFGHDIRDDFVKLGFELFAPVKGDGMDIESQLCFIIGHLLNGDCNILKQGERKTISWDDFLNQFKIIHAGSVLHLLTKEEGDELLNKIASLLQPGGVFLGRTSGSDTAMFPRDGLKTIHSVESLSQSLKSAGFIHTKIASQDRETIRKKHDTITYKTLHFIAELPT